MTWGIKTTRCLLRRVIYVAMRVCYRLSVHGQEHVPKRGAALVVCNHVSFMDALVLGGEIVEAVLPAHTHASGERRVDGIKESLLRRA